MELTKLNSVSIHNHTPEKSKRTIPVWLLIISTLITIPQISDAAFPLAGFRDSGQSLGVSDSVSVALGDLNGDGDLDAFVANSSVQGSRVWLNNGSGLFATNGQVLGSSQSTSVALGDLDGDSDLDAFVGNTQLKNGFADKVWLNAGLGNFTDNGQFVGSSQSVDIALGDVDNDGDLDVFVVTNDALTGHRVWLKMVLAYLQIVGKI